MNLKTNVILFVVLFIAFMFGKESVVLSFYEYYYVLNLMELIVLVLTLTFGGFLIVNILKSIKAKKGKNSEGSDP